MAILDSVHPDCASSRRLINIAFTIYLLEVSILYCQDILATSVQAFFVPSQGFMNALVYGWTRGDFLSVMSAKRYNRGQKLLSSFSATCDVSEKEEEEEAENEGETNWKREGTPPSSSPSPPP